MKFRLFVFSIILIFLTLIFLPIISWYTMEPIQLNIAVIDKTVPYEDYREHLGLFWLLSHLKIVKQNGRLYKLEEDYLGYHPYDSKGDEYLVLQDDLDLIYVADTYGVYTGDYDDADDTRNSGYKSKLIYGGLNIFDFNRIIAAKNLETTLIVEFNSFGSPTSSIVRNVMGKNLSVLWTGWYGRYFSNLKDKEIPDWLIENYENQTGEKWSFSGPGIVFVNNNDQVIIIENTLINDKVKFELTKEGQEHYPLAKNSYYYYWFDIMIPDEEVMTEAVFILDLTEEGEAILKSNNIPVEFPAVMRHETNLTYYFSGDFADTKNNYWSKWKLPVSIKNLIAFFENREEFYWKSYDPMMNIILKDIKAIKFN